jgi:AcrR family transcriptional regulator
MRASGNTRRRQADRRAQTKSALLEAAARGLSTYGYANLALERVASEAGYTRGAIYHLFENKEDLALAVVGWVDETWTTEVGHLAAAETDPVAALTAMARAHAVYCRRDVARVMLALRVEFTGQDHPVGRAIREILDPLEATCARLVDVGRRSGAIPSGPPAEDVANAYLSTLEAVGIALAGREPYDVELAERAVRGLLGLQPPTVPVDASRAGPSTNSTGERTDE